MLKKVGENKDFCNIMMPSEDSKILELGCLQYHYLKAQKIRMMYTEVMIV